MALLKRKVFSFETKAGATATLQVSSPPQGQVGQVLLEVYRIVILRPVFTYFDNCKGN